MIIKDRMVIISRGGWGEWSVTGKEHPRGSSQGWKYFIIDLGGDYIMFTL